MDDRRTLISRTFHLKNMLSRCCILLLAEKINAAVFQVECIDLGVVTVRFDPDDYQESELIKIFETYGFGVITSREKIIV